MEYISSSTRRLTRSLRSLVSYRVKTRKRNCISTRAHVLFFITLRLSSVMLLGTLFFALSKYFSPSSTDNYLQRVVLFMRQEALRILFRLVIFSTTFSKDHRPPAASSFLIISEVLLRYKNVMLGKILTTWHKLNENLFELFFSITNR